jgi:hypothetical protein
MIAHVQNLIPYLAVPAVLDERRACSIVPGRALCVPGRTNPLNGRPDCDMGLANTITFSKE